MVIDFMAYKLRHADDLLKVRQVQRLWEAGHDDMACQIGAEVLLSLYIDRGEEWTMSYMLENKAPVKLVYYAFGRKKAEEFLQLKGRGQNVYSSI